MPLPEDEALHVVRVLRMGEGDRVRLIDGRGSHALGTLVDVGKRMASVTIEEVHHEETRPQGLTLLVAPTKATDRFEWLLEKATELGVEAIVPVWTQRSERRVDKHERWTKVLVAATKQCQRLWMPTLAEAEPLQDALARLTKEVPLAVAHCMEELSNAPDRTSWVDWQRSHHQAVLAIGPEGDFTPEEVEAMVGLGAQPVHLGALRLRTETAGMAAVAQFGREG
jgi:16S rRNA (uracil1498-N3)-methyltransferase